MTQRSVAEAQPRELGYRGRQVLFYVRICMAKEGRPPSYAMIRDELGFSDTVKVLRVIERLENRGLLSRAGEGRTRRIRLHA